MSKIKIKLSPGRDLSKRVSKKGLNIPSIKLKTNDRIKYVTANGKKTKTPVTNLDFSQFNKRLSREGSFILSFEGSTSIDLGYK
jgi:hypothetical protein